MFKNAEATNVDVVRVLSYVLQAAKSNNMESMTKNTLFGISFLGVLDQYQAFYNSSAVANTDLPSLFKYVI